MRPDAAHDFGLEGFSKDVDAPTHGCSDAQVTRAGIYQVPMAVTAGRLSDHAIAALRTSGDAREKVGPMKCATDAHDPGLESILDAIKKVGADDGLVRVVLDDPCVV